ncbi:Bgr_08870 family protein [Candidatus Bartonella washoeensis]|uniref:Glycine-rich domain-containing protein n=1 Tax=Cardidatus Bartonella washoeensis 085-0475 TaxID=1094564 RepID=J0QIA8_9HYPH|nr:Bgr_08870 family protein [Bartonella washoeensis]EJF85271.1 hypothetical protein MCW_00877 [Bartonella washoeensis 085-0475]
MTKTKKLEMELPKEGRFISSEFPILRENLSKIDQAIADVEDKVNQKAPLKHTHTISDVTDLEAALKGKMAADKTFSFADLSDIEGAQDAANNYVLYKASNNHFTFGSAISLLGTHQHKTEDIVGLDEFRAKINEDLTAYGRLKQANEWQNYNKFTSKVTMSGDLELISNSSGNFTHHDHLLLGFTHDVGSSFSLTHNGEVVTHLSATGSTLKGPLKVDGEAVYTKDEATTALQKIRDEIVKLTKRTMFTPFEILITESGPISLPDGVTNNTDIEIWAWGGGGSGGGQKGGGGGGGGCTRIQIKGSQLGNSKNIQIGRGGKNGDGGKTIIEGLLIAGGGGAGGFSSRGNGGSAGDKYYGGTGGGYFPNSTSFNGSDSTFSGGGGGSYGKKVGAGGHGGNSTFGGGGGSSGDENVKGGYSGKGGNGGNSGSNNAGGGGGYFPGKSGDDGGDGGDGAVLLRFFI